MTSWADDAFEKIATQREVDAIETISISLRRVIDDFGPNADVSGLLDALRTAEDFVYRQRGRLR